MRILVVSGAAPNSHDAVGDFAWLLARQLASGHRLSFLSPETIGMSDTSERDGIFTVGIPRGWGIRAARRVVQEAIRFNPDVVLAHFVPQLFGWNGAKPVFAMLLRHLKKRGFPIITIAHEFSAPFGPSIKLAMWATIHRLLFRVVVNASRTIILTNLARVETIRRIFPRRGGDIYQVPVGCTVQIDHRDSPDAASRRAECGVAVDEFLVVTFGSALESTARSICELLNVLSSEDRPVHCLIIGKSGTTLRDKLIASKVSRCRITATGAVSTEFASVVLSMSDLYLALFPDGASTRRTSLMAGLAHGVPTVSNKGALTEEILASSGAIFMMNGRETDTEDLRRLAGSMERRRELGARGRRLFEDHFSWATIGNRYAEIIRDTVRR
jgi:glycosyltransferase involved in cell wall biosynthesis